MSANVEAMVREGVNAAKAGNKEEARALLTKAVELDPYNEDGWLWLSGVVDSNEDQRTCLENVLSINPNNDRARQGVAYLSGKPLPEPPRPAEPPPPPPPAPSRVPTSVEWDMPATESSSPSSWHPVVEPSTSEYDEWVSRLNLASGPETPSTSPAASTPDLSGAAAPFFGFEDETGDNDEFFGSGPFSSTAIASEPAPQPEPAPATTPSFTFRQPPAFGVKTSPVPEAQPEPKGRSSKKKSKTKAEKAEVEESLFDLAPQPEVQTEVEESELFGYIPKTVRATRLPGTRERVPILLVLAAILLVVLNVGAAALLAMRFLMPA